MFSAPRCSSTLYQLLIRTAPCAGEKIVADLQGAYAEYIVSPENMLLTKPKELSWVQAAALPENWMTGESPFSLWHERVVS
jgi:NADPH:quinone reductase-like Zn-dependent oxidoreductase